MKGSNEFDMDEAKNVAAVELQRIEQKYGYLTPEFVVDEARPEGSPIHSRFEWDDSVAGEAYRRGQARQLIRIVVVKNDEDVSPMFVHVTTEDGPRYMSASVVVKDEDLYASALQELASKLRAATKSLNQLVAMGGPESPQLGRVSKHLASAAKALSRVQAPH